MYYTGNAGFLAAACNPNRTIYTYISTYINDEAVTFDPNSIISYKVTDMSVGGSSFVPGSFVAKRLELTLNEESPTVQAHDFKNATIGGLELFAGIDVSGTMVYVPMGIFHIDKDGISIEDGGYVKIIATDIPDILKRAFVSKEYAFPCEIWRLLTGIRDRIHIPIHVEGLPNIDTTLLETFSLTTTYREALMYIAEVLGAYVSMTRDGEICLKKLYSSTVDIGCTLDDNYLFSVDKKETSVMPFQFIDIKANKDDLGVSIEVEGVSTARRYTILSNPLTYGHPEDFLQGIAQATSFKEFFPSKISFQGRPDLDTGDVVNYTYKDVVYNLPICSHTFEYNGGFKSTLESIGSDTVNPSSNDAGIKSQVSAIKQNINSLVRDLESTQSQLIEVRGDVTKITELTQTVNSIITQVSALEEELSKVTTLEQTAENLKISIQSVVSDLANTKGDISSNQKLILTYFDFQQDALTIGVNQSDLKLRLAHNRIDFVKDNNIDNPVAYFSSGKLYVMDAEFIRGIVIGNFEFVPRSNGNLSLKRR